MKDIYEKLSANITRNGERLSAFSPEGQEQDQDICSCYFYSTFTGQLGKKMK